MTIGERIRKKRTDIGLTLEAVGDRVGVTKATIQKYENGLISGIPSDKIELLAVVLKTTPAYLMGWEDEAGNNLLKNKSTGATVDMSLSEEEAALIAAYRTKPEMQNAVKTLLGLPQDTVGADAANVIRSGDRAFAKKDITQG